MTGRILRLATVVSVVVLPFVATATARADVSSASSTNVQQGDNTSTTSQGGNSKSGDAVAGQVAGVVSSGHTSVDATNSSKGASADSGSASASNTSSSFTGLDAGSSTAVIADVSSLASANVQEGDNSTSLNQTATATGGDAVAGEVIGVVTSAGGSADVVAANTSDGASASGGSATARNFASSFVGLNATGTVGIADVASASATNVQEGDNELDASQAATAKGGDGVAGQVLGVVSAGATKLDATNDSSGASGSGGSATSSNSASSFTGLTDGTGTAVLSDVASGAAANLQEGDNSGSYAQTADATAGDGVAGQVAGVVTSAGGSADLVLANTTNSSASSGNATFTNTVSQFVGLNASGVITVF